jgi:Cft2 family RNA processing exonuclease
MQSNLLKNILFLDLETVSQHSDFTQLDERVKTLWEKKYSVLKRDGDPESMYQERAAIYAEFGKIVCIGTGYFTEENGEMVFRTRAIAGSVTVTR